MGFAKNILIFSELVNELLVIFLASEGRRGLLKTSAASLTVGLLGVLRFNRTSIFKRLSGLFFGKLPILLNLSLKLGILFLKSVLLSKNLRSLIVPSHAVDFGKAFFVGLELLIVRINGIIQLVDALAAILGCFP